VTSSVSPDASAAVAQEGIQRRRSVRPRRVAAQHLVALVESQRVTNASPGPSRSASLARPSEAAAAALGVSLSEFVRQSARGRAEEVLRERRDIARDDEDARRFLAELDADAPPPPEMGELFARARGRRA
jgi:uncharacterized protein (DUF1778 family)